MPLFHKNILKKYLSLQNKPLVAEKYAAYKKLFLNPKMQENIRKSKEEEYQGEFLIDLFVHILGYTKKPNPDFNLTTEYKNANDKRKADGAIIIDEKVLAVIELKGTQVVDLKRIEEQAFSYKNHQSDCVYVITSNFEKLRFYIDNAVEFAEFSLFHLSEKDFEILFLCLSFESIKNNLPKKIKTESLHREDEITQKLYADYSAFKNDLYQNLLKNNPQFNASLLFKKTQKLLDRFLFLFFAEDKLLVQPNSVRLVFEKWKSDKDWKVYQPLYQVFTKFFNFLNEGNQFLSVFPYNGGLFATDEFLNNLKIDDEILSKHAQKMSAYDFDSEVDVNILGHIFENSLNEAEEILQKLHESQFSDAPAEMLDLKKISKRKKDGIFYTPKFITKYILENTLGKLFSAQKAAFQIIETDFFYDKKRKKEQTLALAEKLKTYREWLFQITIIDPSCGSGAFLNEALNFLIAEHAYTDELHAKLFGDSLQLTDVEKSILENNLFGVDINEESVEIAKLSLWLRTAKSGRKLNHLNNNIKRGNSLIYTTLHAGESAFDWQKEFPQVFEKGGFDLVIGNPPYVQLQKLKAESEKLAQIGFETYEKTGDLYCLFYEKGYQLLKNGGILGFITSNKWLRAGYGKSLRKFILEKTQPLLLAELGAKIFEGATVDSNVLIFKKEKNTPVKPFWALDLSKEKNFTDFSLYENRMVEMQISDEEAWTIKSSAEQKIKEKIEKAGTPLKKWDIEIYFGIKTGLNEAFMIDSETKNKLIEQDEKSAEIIKPLLRGRDIERYYSNFAKVWLIATFPALNIDIDQYPIVRDYLFSLGKKLEQSGASGSRKKTNNQWFETQDAIAYYEKFEKDCIIWKRIGSILRFSYCKAYYGLDSTCILTGESVKYLLCFLNSKMGHYLLKDAPKTGTGDLLVSVQAIEPLFVPKISQEAQIPFIQKADEMIELNKNLQENSLKFLNNLKREFSLEKITEKLEQWFLLSFADFLKELEKLKVKLKLAQKTEWADYFEAESQKMKIFSAKIAQNDREIDAKIFDLYDLTEEEREWILSF